MNVKSTCLIDTIGARGGVRTLITRLYKALYIEGLNPKIISLATGALGKKGLYILNYNVKDLIRALKNYCDSVIIIGSFPRVGTILDKLKGKKVFLFISGHPIYESMSTLRNSELDNLTRVGALINISQLKLAISLNTINYYIAHTRNACREVNCPEDRLIVLKQFLLREELNFYESVALHSRKLNRDRPRNVVLIGAYTSYASLPGLKLKELLSLYKILSRKIGHRYKPIFYIKDPQIDRPQIISENIIVIGKQQPLEHLKWLVSLDLYIETTIDAELRFTSLEALALGTPVIKLLHPRFYNDEIDYTSNQILLASSIRELIEIIVQYVDTIEHSKSFYSNNAKEYVKERRLWDHVKTELIKRLQSAE